MKDTGQEKKRGYKLTIIRALGAVILVCLAFVLINAGYFWDNLKFTFSPPVPDASSQLPLASTTPEVKAKSNFLEVPSLGIAAPVVYVEGTDEQTFQAGLAKGVVHYPGTALPGEKGNVYIFGHSSDFITSKGSYKRVFALLPRVEIGAEIRLSDSAGKVYLYRVTESFVAEKTRTDLLGPGDGTKSIITLQTSYPVGTALRRWIVRGELER